MAKQGAAAPGLGVKLNQDVSRANSQPSNHFSLFTADWHKRQARTG